MCNLAKKEDIYKYSLSLQIEGNTIKSVDTPIMPSRGSLNQLVPLDSPLESLDVGDDDEPLILNNSNLSFTEDADHCHIQNPQNGSKTVRNQLLVSTALCTVFMIAELLGGYFSNSLAIMTDAAHLLSDIAAFCISLFAIWVAQKSPTKRMSFGYYRAEILGALLSVLIIWVLAAVLVYMAILRVKYGDYEIDTNVMLIVSGCGVAMNIIMGIVLQGCCSHVHSHSHSHGSHSHVQNSSDAARNINLRAAFIHVLGDLLQSVGVLIAAYIIHYQPSYKLADPICTFLFSGVVLFTTLPILKDAVNILMEGFPRDMNYVDTVSALESIECVVTVHSLHIWSLTPGRKVMAVHLAVVPEADCDQVLKKAEALVRRKYKIYHTTIQVEKYQPTIMSSCHVCRGPQK